MFRKSVVAINNWIVRARHIKVPLRNLLLLLPHCLQRTACERKVIHDVNSCRRCGACNIDGLLKLRDELGIRSAVASGGRQALGLARDKEVRAIVAVACEKELFDGILAAFPKPVLAVANRQPNGPCRDTVVDVNLVRAALLEMLEETPHPT